MNYDVDCHNYALKDTPYQLISRIGRGGFADVYLAKHKKSGCRAAIKVEQSQAAAHTSSPLLNEVKILKKLQHPAIIQLMDYGTTQGLNYAVFEHLHGFTLDEWLLHQNTPAASDLKAILLDVLDALTLLHGEGICHNDIKPANIIVSTLGARPHATLIDFGAASYLHGDAGELPAATPGYCAPETLKNAKVSPQTDLYQWAQVCLICLTGRQPDNALPGNPPLDLLPKQLATLFEAVIKAINKPTNKKPKQTTEALFKTLHATDTALWAPKPQANSNRQNSAATQTVVGNVDELNLEASQTLMTVICLQISQANIQSGPWSEAHIRDLIGVCEDTALNLGALCAGAFGDTVLFYVHHTEGSNQCHFRVLSIINHWLTHLNLQNALMACTDAHTPTLRIGLSAGPIASHYNDIHETAVAKDAIHWARSAANNQTLCNHKTATTLSSAGVFVPVSTTTEPNKAHPQASQFLQLRLINWPLVSEVEKNIEFEQLIQSNKSPLIVSGSLGSGRSRFVNHQIARLELPLVTIDCQADDHLFPLSPVLRTISQSFNNELSEICSFSKSLSLKYTDISREHCALFETLLTCFIEKSSLDFNNEQIKNCYELIARFIEERFEYFCNTYWLIENKQWSCAHTHKWLNYFSTLRKKESKPAIIVTTTEPPSNKANQIIAILPWSKAQCAQYIEQYWATLKINKNLLDHIIEQCAGLPFLLVESLPLYDLNGLTATLNGELQWLIKDRPLNYAPFAIATARLEHPLCSVLLKSMKDIPLSFALKQVCAPGVTSSALALALKYLCEANILAPIQKGTETYLRFQHPYFWQAAGQFNNQQNYLSRPLFESETNLLSKPKFKDTTTPKIEYQNTSLNKSPEFTLRT